MPVIRITDATWDRLKRWAIPLEDSPDDAIRKVLEAAEEHLRNLPTEAAAPTPQANKLAKEGIGVTVDFVSFITFCKSLEGQTLSTIGRQKKFKLSSVDDEHLYFIPESSKTKRRHSKRWIQGVLNRYALTGSFRPTDYVDLTRNASYTLALVKLYLAKQP